MQKPTTEVRLQLARAAWRRGTPLYYIIDDGWARGLLFEQTLMECSAAGYSMCVAEPEIRRTWARLNASYLHACKQEGCPVDVGSFMAFVS